jgi:hypothetical protein
MPISALPVPPNLQTNTPVEFTQKTDNLLQALPTFVNEANALQTDVNAKQVAAFNSATAAANSATASANSALAAAAEAASALDSKNRVLAVEANQALDVLNALKTVDGPGSGLDADLLDGQHGSYYAPLESPTFTGTPTATTPTIGTNSTRLATTAFVNAEIANDAVTKTSATGAATLPVGTVAQRPTPATGMFRYNTEYAQFEGYNGSAWGGVGGASGGAGNPFMYLNDQIVTQSYAVPSGKNAMSAGEIILADGVVVDVPDNSTWTVV